MNKISPKIGYFARSFRKRLTNHKSSCLGCGQSGGAIRDRKAWVTTLIECQHCGLLYRTPTDSAEASFNFYQGDYSEGAVTEVPDDDELARLKAGNFAGSPNDYAGYIAVLRGLGCPAGSRIFDYGCSWGYGSYQMTSAGYSVKSYEVSTARQAYAAAELDVDVVSDLARVEREFDVFFSAHVLEHVPDISEVVRLARRITKPGGLFIAFTPNGSRDYRSANWEGFHRSWGLAHPNVLQDKYYRGLFAGQPYLLASDPYPLDEISSWDRSSQMICDLAGWELMAGAVL